MVEKRKAVNTEKDLKRQIQEHIEYAKLLLKRAGAALEHAKRAQKQLQHETDRKSRKA